MALPLGTFWFRQGSAGILDEPLPGTRSVAVPLLATGAGGFPKDVCLDAMFRFWFESCSAA